MCIIFTIVGVFLAYERGVFGAYRGLSQIFGECTTSTKKKNSELTQLRTSMIITYRRGITINQN